MKLLERRGRGRASARVEAVHVLALRVVDDREQVAADAVHRRLDDGEDRGRGDGGVDGVAALLQHLQAGGGRERLAGGDRAVACHHDRARRARVRRGPVAGELRSQGGAASTIVRTVKARMAHCSPPEQSRAPRPINRSRAGFAGAGPCRIVKREPTCPRARSSGNRLRRWCAEYYQAQFSNRTFNPATDLVHYAGRVFDAEELCNLVDASLDFFLTANRYAERFEADFADYLGLSDALFVNSGSSANLVALTTLTSPKLGDRRLQPGDEVDHRGGGLSEDRRADPPEQPGAGLRRRQPRRLQRRSRSAARGHRPEDPRDHDGAHARRAVRPRLGHASSRRSTTCGSSRTTATRSARAIAAG